MYEPKTDLRTFLTFNLFFDGYEREKRLDGTCSMILWYRPDVVFLQEVHKDAICKLMKMLKNSYFTTSTHIDFIRKNVYGNMIFISRRFSLKGFEGEYVPYENSYMGRGMATFKRGEEIYISTHLESLQTPQFRNLREKQISQLEEYVSSFKKVVVGVDGNTRGILSDTLKDEVLPLSINTWFGSRFFDTEGEECYDRFLTSGVESLSVEAIDCEKLSDHDAILLKI